MNIVGFQLDKISGERSKLPTQESVKLNSNFNISSIEKEKTEKKIDDSIFGITFIYSIDYEEFAKIEFKGKIYVSADKKLSKEFEKDKINSIDNNMRTQLLNFILLKTHVDSLRLEETFHLPFHAAAPQVQFEDKK